MWKIYLHTSADMTSSHLKVVARWTMYSRTNLIISLAFSLCWAYAATTASLTIWTFSWKVFATSLSVVQVWSYYIFMLLHFQNSGIFILLLRFVYCALLGKFINSKWEYSYENSIVWTVIGCSRSYELRVLWISPIYICTVDVSQGNKENTSRSMFNQILLTWFYASVFDETRADLDNIMTREFFSIQGILSNCSILHRNALAVWAACLGSRLWNHL